MAPTHTTPCADRLHALPAALHPYLPVLGLFHGGLNLDLLHTLTEWPADEIEALGAALQDAGLASADAPGHLQLAPGLDAALAELIPPGERPALEARWRGVMLGFAGYLHQLADQEPEQALGLARQEAANLVALAESSLAHEGPEHAIELVTVLYTLLQAGGPSPALERLQALGDEALARFGAGWNAQAFAQTAAEVEAALADQPLEEAFQAAQALYQQSRWAGPDAYPQALRDQAHAAVLMARCLNQAEEAEQAAQLLEMALEDLDPAQDAALVAEAHLALGASQLAQGNALAALGSFAAALASAPDSAPALQARILHQQARLQHALDDHPAALELCARARAGLNPSEHAALLALLWQESGLIHQALRAFDEAEAAYQSALAHQPGQGPQADLHNQLGSLYDHTGQPDKAIHHYLNAAELCAALGDLENEGRVRSNLADTLHQLARLDDARTQARQALECKREVGAASAPWTTWALLARIETDARQPDAALEAHRQAVAGYYTHRKGGASASVLEGQLTRAVGDGLLQGDDEARAELRAALGRLAQKPGLAPHLPRYLSLLDALLAGHHAAAEPDDLDLGYGAVVEWTLLQERIAGAQG
jgi:tetratricopeptide (TPR) repeat protein